jgi:hypothetical protein
VLLLGALLHVGELEERRGVVNGLREFVEGADERALLVGERDGFARGVGRVPKPGRLGLLLEAGKD